MVARLKRDIESRASRLSPGVIKRNDLGMRTAGTLMQATAGDFSVTHDDGADGGVRPRQAEPAASQGKSAPHVCSI
jgi:hypothetical protein